MVAFAWVMGVIVALLGGISLLSFTFFIGTGIDVWLTRARQFRRYASAAVLFVAALYHWEVIVPPSLDVA